MHFVNGKLKSILNHENIGNKKRNRNRPGASETSEYPNDYHTHA